jgi:hypothetical protein
VATAAPRARVSINSQLLAYKCARIGRARTRDRRPRHVLSKFDDKSLAAHIALVAIQSSQQDNISTPSLQYHMHDTIIKCPSLPDRVCMRE